MVRKLLLLAGVALSASAFAQEAPSEGLATNPALTELRSFKMNAKAVKAQWNDGSVSRDPMAKAPAALVQWKRPAGQFWGTGFSAEGKGAMLYSPLVLRPWTQYTFENVSTVSGTPTWTVTAFDNAVGNYVGNTYTTENITQEWGLYEMGAVPMLSYANNLPYASQYYGKDKTEIGEYLLCVNENISDNLEALGMDGDMPVSSHVYGYFTRESVDYPMTYFNGAGVYEGMDPEKDGMWFGTNNSGVNAMATRFEKPDQPYLLNCVYFYYGFFQDIPKEIPLKAYVFKTVNDAKPYTTASGVEVEKLEVGDLIATAEAVIPVEVFNANTNADNIVKFEFFEVNPVTGAKTAISLEIEDDITIVVTGFNADLGNGGKLTSFYSTDTYDEGYGNLAFIGSLEEGEDGSFSYDLSSLTTAFGEPIPNTVLGVMAGVSYPWLIPNLEEQPNDVHLPNEDPGVQDQQGLQYILQMLSTSMVEDWEATYNGEDSCDWLSIVDYYDEMGSNSEGDEYYSGLSMLLIQADPNPENVDRTCVLNLSIPGASYEITFRQGTNNYPDAVDVVVVDANAEYYDLQGRKVTNPDKGLYIKKSGNATTKVIL